ncbi:MAG: bifunctional acetate--CoA ligase family protein/GNAT family N-acetyltransferase [Thermodesulfobacteriota bacterium]|nr:bifunctional acetate--CoA ligase family protein/GNAT family N-acetyltransferase [Thermodesulfobacteriota bacterium]
MSIYNLEKIFKPSSIAIIGASEKKESIGYSLIGNIIKGGYQGNIYPVNPNYSSLGGLTSYRSILDIEQPIDLAIIAIPLLKVPFVIEKCVDAKLNSALIVSAGGKEIGAEGGRLEDRIKEEAMKGNIRIIGPNSAGIVSIESVLYAIPTVSRPLPGKIAFISQSGGICSAIIDQSLKEGIGFKYFVNVGSMLDVDFGDLINYMSDDPDVNSIVLYIESLTNMRKFMSAARATSRLKPIVVLKAGRSIAGARAASSHTGALAGEDEVYDVAFKRAGMVRVNTIEELFDCAELMAKPPFPSGPGLAIITNGGGPGVMATDALSDFNLEPVSLSSQTIKRLDEILPPFWSKGNPIDILGDAPPERWQNAINECISAREINALLIIYVPQALSNAIAVAKAILEPLDNKRRLPIFAVWMGGESVEEGLNILNKAGIPTYETPERAIAAFQYMYSYKQNLSLLQEIPPKLHGSLEFDQPGAKAIIEEAKSKGKFSLSETESKNLLKAYGIPVNRTEIARSVDEAIRLAQDIGYPVVMKVHSHGIIHKTDVKGVQLNLRNNRDIDEAFLKIMKETRKYTLDADAFEVTIQPMLSHLGYELIIGSKREIGFGPVILFGMGGVMTEILKDHAIAFPPLNRLLARRLIERTRIYRMLAGYRNLPPAKLELLEEVLIRLSQLVSDFSEITEVDINPLILSKDQVVAVDSHVILNPVNIPAPHHLIISPYPNQYEFTATIKGGEKLFIRPIKPEDAPLLQDLFHALSPKTVYYRFFSPLKSLSPKMLARFTQIDYDREIALVAFDATESEEKMLGVARLISDSEGKKGDLSIVIADPWQGKGIGAILMESLLNIAKERKIEFLYGLVMAENRQMLGLAKKLGFVTTRSKDDFNHHEIRIDMTKEAFE